MPKNSQGVNEINIGITVNVALEGRAACPKIFTGLGLGHCQRNRISQQLEGVDCIYEAAAIDVTNFRTCQDDRFGRGSDRNTPRLAFRASSERDED